MARYGMGVMMPVSRYRKEVDAAVKGAVSANRLYGF